MALGRAASCYKYDHGLACDGPEKCATWSTCGQCGSLNVETQLLALPHELYIRPLVGDDVGGPLTQQCREPGQALRSER